MRDTDIKHMYTQMNLEVLCGKAQAGHVLVWEGRQGHVSTAPKIRLWGVIIIPSRETASVKVLGYRSGADTQI